MKSALERAGGYGGDFATVLASLREREPRGRRPLDGGHGRDSAACSSTRAGRVRPPLVYIAIGLPERLARLRSERMRRLYARALAASARGRRVQRARGGRASRAGMARYGESTRVEFVPFGVDEHAVRAVRRASRPSTSSRSGPIRTATSSSSSRLRRAMPSRSFRLVTTADRARTLATLPPNLDVEADIPFDAMRRPARGGARRRACPFSRTATRARRPCSSRRWRSRSPSSSRARRRSRAATGSSTATTAGSSSRATRRASSAPLADVLRDEWHARVARCARASAPSRTSLTWERYVDRIEAALRDAARRG